MRFILGMGILIIGCGDVAQPAADAKVTTTDGCTQQTWYADCDGDGVAGLGGDTAMACTAPAPSACGGGWTETMPIAGASDCNDTRADVKPGATEVCDMIDNDCDGPIDEDGLTTFYLDADGDGFGNPASSMMTCGAPTGYVTNNTDCDDARNTVYPGLAETCDGLDNDCDLTIDEGVLNTYYRDFDGDMHGNLAMPATACTQPAGYHTSSDDCDDSNNLRYPGKAEVCDFIDNNCNVTVDEGVQTTYYRDFDADGYGNPNAPTAACSAAPSGYVANNTDCDDTRNAVRPNATELCFNTLDDNCSGAQDEAAECSISCNWSGARWLSYGHDGADMPKLGAWVTCLNGSLNYMDSVYTSPPGYAAPPAPAATPLGASGTTDNVVGCNWGVATRWASQGWDGDSLNTQKAWQYGARPSCNGTRVTSLNWSAFDQVAPGQTPVVTSGQLGCDWNGTIWLTHGWNGACAFYTGFQVSCFNNRITHFQWIETINNPNCSKAQD